MKFDKTLFISNLTKEVEAQAKTKVDDVLSKVVDDLMYFSPVGYDIEGEESKYPVSKNYEAGKYKANWQYSFGSPKTDVLAERDDSRMMINCETGRKLKSQIRANKSIVGIHYFTNNVPYAEMIEYGHATHNDQSQATPYAVAGLVKELIDGYIK